MLLLAPPSSLFAPNTAKLDLSTPFFESLLYTISSVNVRGGERPIFSLDDPSSIPPSFGILYLLHQYSIYQSCAVLCYSLKNRKRQCERFSSFFLGVSQFCYCGSATRCLTASSAPSRSVVTASVLFRFSLSTSGENRFIESVVWRMSRTWGGEREKVWVFFVLRNCC